MLSQQMGNQAPQMQVMQIALTDLLEPSYPAYGGHLGRSMPINRQQY